jgi:hypothetical protein
MERDLVGASGKRDGGRSLPTAYVGALALDSSGNLYAGGNFTTAGGVTANYIAKWNGTSWEPLGSGIGQGYATSVNALVLDSSGNLYAGGAFATAGGVEAHGIAKWNGTSWAPLGSGVGGVSYVSVLAFAGNGDLYVGGFFDKAGGKSASNIARWTPPVPPPKATLISPSGSISTSKPTYAWSAVSNSSDYLLYVNDSTGNRINQWFTAAQAGCSGGAGTCSVTPDIALGAGAGKWWVQTRNASGDGPWSDPLSFTVTPPPPCILTLISPSGTIGTVKPTYTWNACSNTTWYLVYVNDSSGHRFDQWYSAGQAGCSGGTGTCSVMPDIALEKGSGKWWVRTWNANGYGAWSDSLIFNVEPVPPDKAILISPSGAAGSNTPTYTWNAVSNATWYYLWVDDVNGHRIDQWYNGAQGGCPSGTGTCSVTPDIALAQGLAKWWIRTWSSNGFGSWSDSMAFTAPEAHLPGKATLVSPSGAITTNKPAYAWNADPYATWYYLWVNDSTGTRIQKWCKAAEAGCAGGAGTCSTAPDVAISTGSAKWWIRTWNANGWGLWSNDMAFIVTEALGSDE